MGTILFFIGLAITCIVSAIHGWRKGDEEIEKYKRKWKEYDKL